MESKIELEKKLQFDKRHNALDQVEQICQARIDYNKEIMKFFLSPKVSEQEIREYISNVMQLKVEGGNEHFDLKSIKEYMTKGAAGDCKMYQKLLDFIKDNRLEETCIDELHWMIAREHYYEKAMINLNGKEYSKHNKKTMIKVLSKSLNVEIKYLTECMAVLEDHISDAERDFRLEFKLSLGSTLGTQEYYIFVISDGSFKRLMKCREFVLEINDLLLKKNDILRRLPSAIIDGFAPQLNKEFNNVVDYYKSLYASPDNFNRELYSKVHGTYHVLRQLKSKISIIFSEASLSKLLELQTVIPVTSKSIPSDDPKKLANPELQIFIDPAPSAAPKPLILSDLDKKDAIEKKRRVDDMQELSKISDSVRAFKEEIAIKTMNYKNRISVERKEKDEQRTIDRKLKQEEIRKSKMSESEEELMLQNKEREGFILLSTVNPSNLYILKAIVSKPTPINIPYRNVVTLIGNEPGKLNGEIRKEGGGSHRRIIINGALGFFDEVIGGTFKPHGAEHTSCLPRPGVVMISETLARAGINMNLINILEEAREYAKRYALNLDWKDKKAVLDVFEQVKNRHRKISFLMGYHRKLGANSSVGVLNIKENQSLVKSIFSHF